MDYRKILAAYIRHVGHEEGTDFLGWPIDGLSDDENAALHEVAAEGAEGAHKDYLFQSAQEMRAKPNK